MRLTDALACFARTAGIALVVSSCASPPRNLDAETLWQQAEGRHAAVVRAVTERQQLQSDYAAIIRLSRDGDLRGRAFIGLAQLNVALGEYEQAYANLEQALRAGLSPQRRRRALLMLGDLMERHLDRKTDAATAYRQVVNEYSGTPESELAELRLGQLSHEPR